MSVKVGAAYPLHAGASSKALLAFLPADEIDDYLRRSELDALTTETITDGTILRRELDQIRQQGFAVSLGERQAGAGSVAAPVLNDRGEVVMVVGPSGCRWGGCIGSAVHEEVGGGQACPPRTSSARSGPTASPSTT